MTAEPIAAAAVTPTLAAMTGVDAATTAIAQEEAQPQLPSPSATAVAAPAGEVDDVDGTGCDDAEDSAQAAEPTSGSPGESAAVLAAVPDQPQTVPTISSVLGEAAPDAAPSLNPGVVVARSAPVMISAAVSNTEPTARPSYRAAAIHPTRPETRPVAPEHRVARAKPSGGHAEVHVPPQPVRRATTPTAGAHVRVTAVGARRAAHTRAASWSSSEPMWLLLASLLSAALLLSALGVPGPAIPKVPGRRGWVLLMSRLSSRGLSTYRVQAARGRGVIRYRE